MIQAGGAAAARPRGRLHLLGVPHTVADADHSVCAFTAKVLTFPDIIQPFGWDVFEYGNEGSASSASEHVTVLTREALRALSRRTSRTDPHELDVENAALQARFREVLLERISARARAGDVVAHVFGPDMEVHARLPDCRHLELSVGYTATPGLPFRVYESSAWMHWHHGKAGREDGSHYQWVIPSGFDPAAWPLCEAPEPYALFLGRLTLRKGMNELLEIARRSPELPIRAYGPGDASHWAAQAPPNLSFHGPVFGAERREVVRRARCMLMPTVFIEPFGFSGVEAQLCGTPLIASSYGAFQETVEDGVTGFRCHTLADWTEAIRLSAALDRRRISQVAAAKYSQPAVGAKYDRALRQLCDLSDRGWYGERSRKFEPQAGSGPAAPRRRVWLYIPWFGPLPDFFQLYLDSLARNADRLTVVMPTDVDLSSYAPPANLLPVPMSFEALRRRAWRLLAGACDLEATPPPEDFLSNAYKLCDLKITYPELFDDIGATLGVTEEDFVGWGDCDLIYGRLDDFLPDADGAHAIGGLFGHFTALRNTTPLRRLWSAVPDLVDHLRRPEYRVVDEAAFRGPLFDHLRLHGLTAFELHRHVCDVVPEVFRGLFRPDHAARTDNFFDTLHPRKTLDHVLCDADGRLTVRYTDGSARPVAYCHLQKRRMEVRFGPTEAGMVIEEHAFAAHREVR